MGKRGLHLAHDPPKGAIVECIVEFYRRDLPRWTRAQLLEELAKVVDHEQFVRTGVVRTYRVERGDIEVYEN